jgi:hypothetical protein
MVVQHRTRVGLSDHLTGHPQPAVSLSPPNVPEPAQPPLEPSHPMPLQAEQSRLSPEGRLLTSPPAHV